ncbi:hypothetical protein, partial [Gracilimonas sp.]|uniref:hypothetical protein n=1 Tax=Gracilimonas sp. TaxID=1974203 RepID=UPI0025BACD53
ITDSSGEIALSSVGLFIQKVKLVTISAFVRVDFVIHGICFFWLKEQIEIRYHGGYLSRWRE